MFRLGRNPSLELENQVDHYPLGGGHGAPFFTVPDRLDEGIKAPRSRQLLRFLYFLLLRRFAAPTESVALAPYLDHLATVDKAVRQRRRQRIIIGSRSALARQPLSSHRCARSVEREAFPEQALAAGSR